MAETDGARSKARDVYALLAYGVAAELPDEALRGVVAVEVLTLCLLWAAILAYCHHRHRRLQAVATQFYRDLHITPLLYIQRGDISRSHRDFPYNVKLIRGGRWLAVVSYACAYYPLYQPSFSTSFFTRAFGGACRDDDCIASCRTGRKTLLCMCTLTLLLILYASWVRQTRSGEDLVNMTIKILLSVPGSLSSILAPCWHGRGNEVLKPSPAINAAKVLGFVFNLDVLLPSGVVGTAVAALFHTASMSTATWYFLPENLQQNLGLLYWIATSWLPVAHITSLLFLLGYHRESRHLATLLNSAQTHYD